MALFSLLLLGVRQEAGLNLFGIGIYLIITRRHWIQGLIMAIFFLHLYDFYY